MSLILDALKKLEQETATHQEGRTKISDQILRPDRTKPNKYKGLVILSIAAALGGAVTAVVLIGGFPALMAPSSPPPTAPSISSHQVTKQLPAMSLPVHNRQVESKIENVRPSIEYKPETAAAKATSRTESTTNLNSRISEVSEPSAEDSLPALTVSGIVWQEERHARRAFVNNIIAREGSVIDGVKVMEIYPTRIRFLKGTKLFEISIEN